MAEPSDEQLGRHLRRLREWQGLTQQQLATLAGLSLAAVQEAEQGKGGLHLDLLHAFARALNVKLSEIFITWEICSGARAAAASRRHPGH